MRPGLEEPHRRAITKLRIDTRENMACNAHGRADIAPMRGSWAWDRASDTGRHTLRASPNKAMRSNLPLPVYLDKFSVLPRISA